MYPNQQNNNNKLSKVFSGKASIEDTYLIDIYIKIYSTTFNENYNTDSRRRGGYH